MKHSLIKVKKVLGLRNDFGQYGIGFLGINLFELSNVKRLKIWTRKIIPKEIL